ncbi:MAG TPA: hypothetical protein VHT24_00975, partial [Pseudacidobacterium sp.]|nr:hypothetical protein [Pseudacidobacterium sp.]
KEGATHYDFIEALDPAQMEGRELRRTAIELREVEGAVQIVASRKEVKPRQGPGMAGAIVFDAMKAAEGLATIYTRSYDRNRPAAFINIRQKSAQIAFIRHGDVMITRNVTNTGDWNVFLQNVQQVLNDSLNLYSSVEGKQEIYDVYLSGESELIPPVYEVVRKQPKLRNLRFNHLRADNLPLTRLSGAGNPVTFSEVAPEIGYALRNWDNARKARSSSAASHAKAPISGLIDTH